MSGDKCRSANSRLGHRAERGGHRLHDGDPAVVVLAGVALTFAAVLVTMQTGLLALHDHLSRALGADILTPEGHVRMSRAVIDLHAQALLSPELAAQAHAAYDRLPVGQPLNPAEPKAAAEGT